MWVGGRDFITEGTFTWSDGSNDGFLNTNKAAWGGTLADSTTADYNDCVYISTSGQFLNDDQFFTKSNFSHNVNICNEKNLENYFFCI